MAPLGGVTADDRAALLLAADVLGRLPAVLPAERARRRDVTQGEAAEQVGVSIATWRRWEAGERFPGQRRVTLALLRWIAGPGPAAREGPDPAAP